MPMLFHDDQLWMKVLVSPIFFLGLSALWVFGVFALVNFMMTHKAVNVKSLMAVYNVVQIVVCSYMVWGLLPCIGFPNVFGINTEFDKAGEWFVFVHYLSKYLDWFDTLWIILSKKRSQLSFLHVYHHGTIVAVWGILLHSGVGSGCVRYGAFANSLTHVIMYTHYLVTSFGIRNPFKAYITMWQISQFYSCLIHAFVALMFEKTRVKDFAWLQVVYQCTMVYLFSKMMSWVPACVPDFSTNKEDTPVSLSSFCNPESSTLDETQYKDVAWAKKLVVIRGDAYDLTHFKHPGGSQMIDLAIGRDCTVMFESSHVRQENAERALAAMPKLSVEELEKKGFDFGRKETFPTPGKSELYQTIRKRVCEEVLKPLGRMERGAVARGVPTWHFLTVIGTWLFAAAWFITKPSVPAGMLLGWSLAWIGTGVQHTANHGGLCKDTTLGYIIGLLDDIAVGGSSIVWRYHHHVSHHAYCNDIILDQDAHSSFPLLRTDSSQQWQPYHRFQWLYGPFLFCFLWISTQFQDLDMLLNSQSFMVKFKGTPSTEIVFAVLLKVIHFWWLVVLPYYVHGAEVMLYPWIAAFGFGGFSLAAMFIVSHNVDEAKIENTGDWARQQIETSTSWGGAIGSFFCGGLNLQIEHHLFPCMAHHLYAPASKIVKEECAKRGIRYSAYPTLLHNFVDHIKFLKHMGNPDEPQGKKVD
jgi:fatty acid desaturase (delta-4 desaturase)